MPTVGRWRFESVKEVFFVHHNFRNICHADFHEFLESQPNLLKAISSCDNLCFWAQQPNPQSASNGEVFMTVRSGAASGNDDEEEDRGLGLEPQRGSRTDDRDEASNS